MKSDPIGVSVIGAEALTTVRPKRSRLLSQVALLFGSNALDRVLGLAGSIIVARYLGALELGRIGPALVLGALVARFTDLGVSITVQRDVARSPQSAAHLLARGLGFRLLSTTLGALLVLAYAVGTEGLTTRAWLPILAGGAALSTGWFQMFAAVWLGAFRSEFVAIAQAVYRLLYLGLLGLVVLIGGGSNHVMLALLIASTAQLLLGVGLTRRTLFTPAVRVDMAASRALIKDSWPIGLSAFTVMAYDRVDTLVASWFLAPVIVGNYVAAYALYSAALTLSNALTSVGFSVFSAASVAGREVARQYRKALALTTVLGAALSLGLLLTAPLIVRLVFGATYAQAGACLRILAVAVAFLFANNLAGVTLNALDRQRTTMMVTVGALVFNVALNVALIPRFGIAAAAWTTVATEFAAAVVACVAVQEALRRRAGNQGAIPGGLGQTP